MVLWAAQALLPHAHGAAWKHGDSVAVFTPKLNRGDRLVFTGSPNAPGDAAELLRQVLPLLRSERLRPLAGTDLARGVVPWVNGLHERATFGWMDLAPETPARLPPARDRVRWLTSHDLDDATSLLRKANPDSYVFPADPEARRWAGMRDAAGTLVSVAADAWSAPAVGFIAGVGTHPDHRGRGLSGAVCGFLVEHLRRDHGKVALMVDEANDAALSVYRRLGFTYRSVTALSVDADV
jgi:ribosomal protein S18 acetylase RimI-like enzyme